MTPIISHKDVPKMVTPFASTGGTGSFDRIFVSGIVAVLLAWVVAGRIGEG
ncbi:MAG: DUF1614 domain-containing protein [Gallionella sp.]